MPRPRPRVPPVTTMLGMSAGELARVGDVQGRHEADRDGDLVSRQCVMADLEYLTFEQPRHRAYADAGWLRRHHIGDHDRAGDRVPPGLHQRHPNARMTVDDRLDLLRVHFEAAHVDDAALSADEVVAVTPPF